MIVEKVACLTGGASGIGLATAELLHARGYKISILDVDRKKANTAEQQLRAIGAQPAVCTGSVSVQSEVDSWIGQTIARWGRIDCLANVAGVRRYGTLTDTDMTDWTEIFAVNVLGTALCSRAAVPHIAKVGGGSIVNMSSIRAFVAGGNTTFYEATKAAVLGLTRGMATDFASQAIRVNAVCPGPIMTDFHEQYVDVNRLDRYDFCRSFSASTLMRRPGMPHEVAEAIAFLLSDSASYITGASIVIDGGQLAHSPNDAAARYTVPTTVPQTESAEKTAYTEIRARKQGV